MKNNTKHVISMLTVALFAIFAVASTDEEETSAPPENSSKTALQVPVACGNVEATITSVSTRNSVGGEYLRATASEGGVYVVVKWSYKNITKKPINMFEGPSLTLVAGDGTRYDSDVDASSSFASEGEDDEKIVSDLNPGIKVKGSAVFEVSKELYDPSKWSILVESGGSSQWFKIQ